MSNNLIIELNKRQDRKKNAFYVGKIKAPIMIDCSKGVSFIVFISEEGVEQLQIAELKQDKDNRSLNEDEE